MSYSQRDQSDMSKVIDLLSAIAEKVDMLDRKVCIIDQKVDSTSQELQKMRGFEPGQSSNRLMPQKDDNVSVSTSTNDRLSPGDVGRWTSEVSAQSAPSNSSSGTAKRRSNPDQIAAVITQNVGLSESSELSCRARLDAFLNDPDSSLGAGLYVYASTLTTLLAVLLTMFQAVQPAFISGAVAAALDCTLEVTWAIEYMLRLACSPKKKSFLSSALSIVELVAIMPFFVRASVGFVISISDADSSSAVAFLLFAVPVLRLLKILRSFKKFNLLLTTALRVYVETVPVMLILFWLLLIFSALLYAAEPRDNVATYQQAMWFVIVTMTTVGYGDVTPSSSAGYIVCSVLVSVSVLTMAMPIGIIGTSVAEVWKERHTILLRSWAKQRLSDWGYTAQQIPALFEAFDPNGDGELSFGEFREMMKQMRIGMKDEKIFDLFQSFDADGSGSVDSKEFIAKLFPTEYIAMYETSQPLEDDQHGASGKMSIAIIPASPRSEGCMEAWS